MKRMLLIALVFSNVFGVRLLLAIEGLSINVKSYGAVGDGVTNNTTAFTNAFAAVCAASGNLYIPKGVYMSDPINVINRCGIIIYGDGSNLSIVRANSNTINVFWQFNNGTGKSMTIQDLALDGRHLELAGVDLDSYNSVSITRVNIHDWGTPGYAAGHRTDYDGLYIAHTTNAAVNNSTFTGNERIGLEMQGVHYSKVISCVMSGNGSMGGVSEQTYYGALDGPLYARWYNNTLVGNGGGGIDTETAPTLTAAKALMSGNTVLNCGNDSWGFGWGLVIGRKSYGTIIGNEVDNFAALVPSGNYTNAIEFGNAGGAITISNNIVKGTKTYAILADTSSFAVHITGNTVTTQQTGIFAYQCPGVVITGNTVQHSTAAGISIGLSPGYTQSGNTFLDNHPDVTVF